MELKPGIGIDDIKFGMTQEELIAKLGNPDRMLEDMEDEDTLFLEYNDKKLRLSIYQADGNRLSYLTTSHPDVTYQGHKIIQTSIEEARSKIFASIVDNWELDDYDLMQVYGNDDYWLTLNVEYGVVVSIELGVMINDDQEFDWPA